MASAGLQLDVNLREINKLLCKNCRKKLRMLVKGKITDQLVDQVIGGEVQ